MNYDKYIIPLFLIIAVIGASFFVPPFIAAMLIPATVVGVLLLGYPRQLLFLYLTVMGVIALLQLAVPIEQIKYLDEVFGIALFGIFFGHIAMGRMSFRDAKMFGNIAYVMFAFILFSWLINRGSPRAALQSAASYFSFVVAYIIALKYLKKGDFNKLLAGTIVFFWINFILNAAWQLRINPLPNFAVDFARESGGRVGIVDFATGTFGGCNYVAYFCVMLFFLLISVLKSSLFIPKKLRFWMKITIGGIFIQLYLTFTNHAYILFAVALVPYLLVSGLWKRWWVYAIGLISVVGLLFLYSVSDPLQLQFSQENLQYRSGIFSEGAKGQLYQQLLVDNARETPLEWLIGVGPGNGMGPIGKDNLTPFAVRMLLPFYQSTGADQRTMQMTSVSGSTNSGIFTIWGDFGLIGFFVFISFYVWLLARSVKFRRTGKGIQPVIAEFLIGAIPFFLLVNIFIDLVAIEAFTIWIWFFSALMNLPNQKDGGTESPNP